MLLAIPADPVIGLELIDPPIEGGLLPAPLALPGTIPAPAEPARLVLPPRLLEPVIPPAAEEYDAPPVDFHVPVLDELVAPPMEAVVVEAVVVLLPPFDGDIVESDVVPSLPVLPPLLLTVLEELLVVLLADPPLFGISVPVLTLARPPASCSVWRPPIPCTLDGLPPLEVALSSSSELHGSSGCGLRHDNEQPQMYSVTAAQS